MKESDKTRIILDLPPHLEAYCRAVFKTPPSSTAIQLNRRHHLGEFIFGCISVEKIWEKRDTMLNPVEFILPDTDGHIVYAYRTNYVYFKKWVEVILISHIEGDFRIHLKAAFAEGYDRGWKQDRIVLGILRELNLRSNAVNYEMVKKIDYRNRRKKEEKDGKEILKYE